MIRRACRCLAVALLCAPLITFAQEGMPRRKPGLWETTMQMPGRGGTMTAQHCIDAGTDEQAQRRALDPEGGARCEQHNVKRSAGGYEAEYSCQGPRGKTEGRMSLKGDFDSHYTLHNEMRFDPPRGGRSEASMTMEGRWKGACPEGMKPGETRMGALKGPGGRELTPEQSQRVQQMMERMRQQQQKAPN